MSGSEEMTIEVKHEDLMGPSVEDQDDDDEPGDLMIVDHEAGNGRKSVEDDEEDEDDNGVNDVHLDKLPRPVNELNCRQSRTWLVKLLRAANGGLNPQVG